MHFYMGIMTIDNGRLTIDNEERKYTDFPYVSNIFLREIINSCPLVIVNCSLN